MKWIDATRARLRLLFARGAAEARMDEEFRFHLEMEAERLVREHGLDAGEARRRARLAFGGVEKHREALREGRGPAWLSGMSLDFRLGFRMLVKYPGLTIVGGLAMAFAIWVGAVTWQLVGLFMNPVLPLPDGDRIVQISTRDVAANEDEERVLFDFAVWRDALRSVTDLGAFRNVKLNLIAANGAAQPVVAAEMTASGFRIAPDRPLLGRTLLAADEQPGAPPVVVLGYDVWMSRFAGDADVVGRSVRLDGTYATVVGVMPDGFAFPVSHDLWVPLQPDALGREPRNGPPISVFARLAPGFGYREARAELTTVTQRLARDFPDTHEHLRARIAPYAQMIDEVGEDRGIFMAIRFFPVLLLLLVCSNVALLLFARAATRESELVVRTALGATRSRIGVQLFVEALVLGGVATVVGLAAAELALRRWGGEFLETNLGRLPFWFDFSVTPTTLLYACALTLLGALVAGVLPALKATHGLGVRLRQGTAGAGGLRFGGVWTVVIVIQVAATVAFPAVAFLEQSELARVKAYAPGFAAAEFLAVRLDMDATEAKGEGTRYAEALERLRDRVAAAPDVRGVTFVDRLPRLYHRQARMELDGVAEGTLSPAQQAALREVRIAAVDVAYFDVLGAPILAGRGFAHSDYEPGASRVIVDQAFVDEVLHGQNAVGRRIRRVAATTADGAPAEEHPWHEIVGVVPELGMQHAVERGRPAGLYLPTPPGRGGAAWMVLHGRGDPMALVPLVRAHATAVDPLLRTAEFQSLDSVVDDVLWFIGLWLRLTLVLSAIALLLSLAGIYAVLSFTVARRTREIGTRVALGASRRRVLTDIFRRPLTQVGIGVLAGGALIGMGALALAGALPISGDGAFADGGGPVENVFSPGRVALFLSYITLMFGVCLLACMVPTRRALGVEPMEALREQ